MDVDVFDSEVFENSEATDEFGRIRQERPKSPLSNPSPQPSDMEMPSDIATQPANNEEDPLALETSPTTVQKFMYFFAFI